MAEAMPRWVVVLQIIFREKEVSKGSRHANVGGFHAIPEYNAQQLHSLGSVQCLQTSLSSRRTIICSLR